MAESKYKFGIVTKPATGEVFEVSLESVKVSEKITWVAVIGEDGKQSERRAKSVTRSITFDGTVKKEASGVIGAAGVIKIGDKYYAFTDKTITEPAGDYHKFSATVERIDEEDIIGISVS